MLSGLEEACADAEASRATCQQHPGRESFVAGAQRSPDLAQFALRQWFLEPAVPVDGERLVLDETFDGSPDDKALSPEWVWYDLVPTGFAVRGNTICMAEAGPASHPPQDGKVVSFRPRSPTATEVASGARLLVDVEFGRGRKLYALSQGILDGAYEGSPALPNTSALVEVNGDGTVTVITDGLDRPTSLEFIGDTAYVVTLGGEIWKIDNVSGPPYGVSR